MQSRQVSGESATKINMTGVTVHSQRLPLSSSFLVGGGGRDEDGWVLPATTPTNVLTSLCVRCVQIQEYHCRFWFRHPASCSAAFSHMQQASLHSRRAVCRYAVTNSITAFHAECLQELLQAQCVEVIRGDKKGCQTVQMFNIITFGHPAAATSASQEQLVLLFGV